MNRSKILAVLAVAAGVHLAAAQPQPGNKVDAKSLMQSGLKLFEAKDYLGALAVFENAYAQFPSAKILLNIGTTEALLDRNADAANSYQKYLDSADADPEKKADVAAELATLDAKSGQLELAITPDDAEVLLGDEWRPAKSVHLWRVVPGAYTVKVRRDGYQPAEKQDAVAAGFKAVVTIALVANPKPVEKQVIVTVPRDEVHAEEPMGPRSRFGAIALAHVSVVPKLGSALLLGATADLTEQLSLDAAIILAPGLVTNGTASMSPPSFGTYVGANFAFLTGKLRPRVSVAMPVFFDVTGTRFVTRAAGGLEYVASSNFALVLDLGAELGLNNTSDIDRFALVPSLGATGRL